MESVAPPLKCLLEVKLDLLNGESIRPALVHYIEEVDDEFSRLLKVWLFYYEQGKDFQSMSREIKSPYRRVLIEIFEVGLMGQPILKRLEELESEIILACDIEVEEHLTRLPFLALFPLFFFQLPAFLLLLLGPLLSALLESLN